jgi:hypothetical protein
MTYGVTSHSELFRRAGASFLTPDGSYCDVFVRAESLDISLGDGQYLTLREFLALGEGYWKMFAARHRENESG